MSDRKCPDFFSKFWGRTVRPYKSICPRDLKLMQYFKTVWNSQIYMCFNYIAFLTHWGRVTRICVGKLTNIDSDNGLSPGWRQAIIWTNAGILLIGPLGTNFSEILIRVFTFSFNKMHVKMSSGKWRPFCLGLNVLNDDCQTNVLYAILS